MEEISLRWFMVIKFHWHPPLHCWCCSHYDWLTHFAQFCFLIMKFNFEYYKLYSILRANFYSLFARWAGLAFSQKLKLYSALLHPMLRLYILFVCVCVFCVVYGICVYVCVVYACVMCTRAPVFTYVALETCTFCSTTVYVIKF